MDPRTTCCFTGHRPDRLPWGTNEDDLRCHALKLRLRAALDEAYAQGYRRFLCGMAMGTDLYFCEAVLALRASCPDVTIEAAVPYAGQADQWPARDRARWAHLLARCDRTTVLQPRWSAGCMQRRNRYMVDRSSLLLAAYDGQPRGGTANTLLYALRQGLRTVVMDPTIL